MLNLDLLRTLMGLQNRLIATPLDYYFWDRVQEKVYDGRYRYPFATIDEVKRRIHGVWDECATDLTQIRKAMKQFLPRLEGVGAKEGGSIKTVFG